ncbi:MAG: DNA polymerase [Jatrophihabitantaceae bacterium]
MNLADVSAQLRAAGFAARDLLALAYAPGVGVGLAAGGRAWALAGTDASGVVCALEAEFGPRWLWWSGDTAAALIADGVRVSACWDLAAVHRVLFGGWNADPATVWAALHELSAESVPGLGQLDLLRPSGDDGGDPQDPVRPDRYLRPEWAGGGWARTPQRLQRWAATAQTAAARQRERLAALTVRGDQLAGAHCESAAELICAELAADGLPVDVVRAEQLIASFVGVRPSSDAEAEQFRRRRDSVVLTAAPGAEGTDLRNPAQVRAMLARLGFEVPDTRSWRLEPFRGAHPVIEVLLSWRKAERIATTFGYGWLDANVGADGRLRGAWTGCDGAAGRMTAGAGLHNLPGELRPAIVAEPGFVFVRADLGQIEPRVLAAISADRALAAATADDDLYAPVAARLAVERKVAKVAVLAAMYGGTSGTAADALRGLESAYPVAMRYLKHAYDDGRAARDVRTFGGRLVRMWPTPPGLDAEAARAHASARGRYARNAVVQGSAAELFKAWAATLRAQLAAFGAQIVLCLHDELLVHVPIAHAEAVRQGLHDCLDEAARRWTGGAPVRFVADVSVITRWSDAKP